MAGDESLALQVIEVLSAAHSCTDKPVCGLALDTCNSLRGRTAAYAGAQVAAEGPAVACLHALVGVVQPPVAHGQDAVHVHLHAPQCRVRLRAHAVVMYIVHACIRNSCCARCIWSSATNQVCLHCASVRLQLPLLHHHCRMSMWSGNTQLGSGHAHACLMRL